MDPFGILVGLKRSFFNAISAAAGINTDGLVRLSSATAVGLVVGQVVVLEKTNQPVVVLGLTPCDTGLEVRYGPAFPRHYRAWMQTPYDPENDSPYEHAQAKPAQAKPAQAKPAQAKPAQAKPAQAKAKPAPHWHQSEPPATRPSKRVRVDRWSS